MGGGCFAQIYPPYRKKINKERPRHRRLLNQRSGPDHPAVEKKKETTTTTHRRADQMAAQCGTRSVQIRDYWLATRSALSLESRRGHECECKDEARIRLLTHAVMPQINVRF